MIFLPCRIPSDIGSATEEFAEYLRTESWRYGLCDNDGVIVVSIGDRQVIWLPVDVWHQLLDM